MKLAGISNRGRTPPLSLLLSLLLTSTSHSPSVILDKTWVGGDIGKAGLPSDRQHVLWWPAAAELIWVLAEGRRWLRYGCSRAVPKTLLRALRE